MSIRNHRLFFSLKNVHYTGNLGNDRPRKKSSPSLIAAIVGTWGVLMFNVLSIEIILKKCGIIPHKSNNLVFEEMIFVFSVLSIYFFLFKKYKIVDTVLQYSLWKNPLIWGVVYIFLSMVSLLVIAIISPISGK